MPFIMSPAAFLNYKAAMLERGTRLRLSAKTYLYDPATDTCFNHGGKVGIFCPLVAGWPSLDYLQGGEVSGAEGPTWHV